jgi:hypothetical protein
MNVAIKTLLRSVPTQNLRPPPNAMKCFVPPVISGLPCSEDNPVRTFYPPIFQSYLLLAVGGITYDSVQLPDSEREAV